MNARLRHHDLEDRVDDVPILPKVEFALQESRLTS